MQEQLKQYPVVLRIPVQWGDMDAAAHVNNLVYLRWSESGRIAYFDAVGLDISFASEEVAGPILGWQECKYIFPMVFPDTAIVGTRVSEILPDRIIMESAVFSEKHQRIAALTTQRIIPYDYKNLCKVALPTSWKKAVEEIESRVR